MTEPSQYFKGRTVQEQMDEIIGYVDKRAEEVAAAKADDVLQPAEAAKNAAQAAAQKAEAAKNVAIAALPDIQQDISDLKVENAALDGRLNGVELKVQTAEGNIVTIQGKIAALQTADGQNIKIDDINRYVVGLTGNQSDIGGEKTFKNGISAFPIGWHPTFTASGNIGDVKLFAKLKNQGSGKYIAMMLTQISNTAACAGLLVIHNSLSQPTIGWISRGGSGINNPLTEDSIIIASDGVDTYLGSRKKTAYGDLNAYVVYSNNYEKFDTNPTPQIEWLDNAINIGSGSGYTIVEASQ